MVVPANYNALGQTVIAGHTLAVKAALSAATNAKIARIIPVSVPCHCSLLEGAALEFREVLEDVSFNTPTTKVINNVDVKIYNSDITYTKDSLYRQLFKPVRWVEILLYCAENNISQLLECGPGKVLSGLVRRTTKDIKAISLNKILED